MFMLSLQKLLKLQICILQKTTHKMANKYRVTVATSDALEQLIIMGHGALRMSAMNFKEEVDLVNKKISESINKESKLDNYLLKDINID